MRRMVVSMLVAVAVVGVFAGGTARADAYNINFDTVMTTVGNSPIWDIAQVRAVLPAGFSMSPSVCDMNGGFDISVTPIVMYPNGMLDSDEFALVAAILANPNFDCSATGGTTHKQVHDAWNRDYMLANRDLGGAGSRIIPTVPDVDYLFAGMMIIGDQDTLAFPLMIMDLIINNTLAYNLFGSPGMAVPNPDEYTLLYPYLGWCGDADGDGCSNLHEYQAVGGNRTQYIAAALDPAVHPAGCTDDRICDGSGGLLGEYFATRYLTDLKATRMDHQVTFDWGNGVPHPSISANNFSVCWSGFVTPEFSEVYDFLVRTDDGVRLWVNGELLVDQWNDHGSTTYTGTTSVPLEAKKPYAIRMDFYENGGDAVAWLGWESASQTRKGIYEMYLTPGPGIGDRGTDWIRNPANGHYYKLTPSITWTDGNTLAGQWGGYLTTINDAAENAWIHTMFGPCADVMFIGANDIQTEGKWVWAENGANFYNGNYSAGATVPPWYSNWAGSEPNDSGSNEDAGMIYAGGNNGGTWNDLSVGSTRACLVESSTGRINLSGPSPASLSVREEGSFTLVVQARHPYGNVTYQWRKNGQDIDGATESVYKVDSVLFSHAGRYTCVVTDESPAVQESDSVQLSVLPKIKMPAASMAALAGLAAALALAGARRRRA